MLIWPTKDPDEILTYTVDFSARLGTDTITGTPTVTVTGATKDSQSNTTTGVTVKISAGTTGTLARVLVRVVTAGGLTLEETVLLPIGGDPVGLDEARDHVHVTSTDTSHDAKLTRLLRAAVGHVEAVSGTRLLTQTVVRKFPGFQEMKRFPIAPLQSVVITYLDNAGLTQTLDPTIYNVLIGMKLSPTIELAFGKTFPITLPHSEAVTVTAVVGYGEPGDVPEDLRHAIMLLIGDWFDMREDTVLADQPYKVPNGVRALLANHRAY